MEFLQNIAIYPSAGQILLLKVIIGLMLVIHIPYISFLAGGTLFSLVFSILDRREENPMHLRFAKEIVALTPSKGSAPILLGVLPLLTLILAFAQLYQGTQLKMSSYVLVVTIFAVAGIILLNIFKNSFDTREKLFSSHVLTGLAALGAFFAGYLIFASASALVLYPEKWPFVQSMVPFFVYENDLPRHGMFVFFTLAFSGTGIAYFLIRWRKGSGEYYPEHDEFVKKFCATVGLIFVLLLPLMIAWNLLTLPNVAASELVFAGWIVTLLLLMVVSVLLFSGLSSGSYRFTATFVLLLVAFSVMCANDQIAAGNASYEHQKLLAKKASDAHDLILAAREAQAQAATQVDGETIFTNVCSACHTFDQRVVGPPYNDILPKYQQDRDGLVNFILNPVKVDPNYPPMPNQGLKQAEAEAVADYLLGEFAKTQ